MPTVEWLALPGWQAPPADINDWARALTEACGPTTVDRESAEVHWVEVGPMRVRGYAVIEGGKVAAVNFELFDPDLEPARAALEAAADALGWELHADDPDDEDDDDPSD